jgi:CRISPR-associated protein Csx17
VSAERLRLTGLRAESLAGYLGALGLVRVLALQADPDVLLSWDRDVPVLHTWWDPTRLRQWLLEEYRPTPILSPWNSGSGFNDNGKSASAEKTLRTWEQGDDPRFAPLRTAIEHGRAVVAYGRRRGWAGGTMWDLAAKSKVLARARFAMPEEVAAWIDTAAALAGTGLDPAYNPLAGTGGNLGRQELSATFLASLLTVLGPERNLEWSGQWADAALSGREDVRYLRETVGQFDPGRAGGIFSSPREKLDDAGFANPWRTVLACEGLVLFASAVVRRQGTAAGGALPFIARTSPYGYGTAAPAEKSKGELWAPLWGGAADLTEIEGVFGEGRARYDGAQARTGLDFVLAAASLGVERGIERFRRFVFVERLGQNPLAVRATDVPVAAHGESRLIREGYRWISRVGRFELPTGIEVAHRRALAAVYTVATGGGHTALREFVAAFGLLHEAVARSGKAREHIRPFQPATAQAWQVGDVDADAELCVAAALAGLHTSQQRVLRPLLRPFLTRVSMDAKGQLSWSTEPGCGIDLTETTLPRALAAAHRRHTQDAFARHQPGDPTPATGVAGGPLLPLGVTQHYVDGDLDEREIADLLRGLLILGWHTRLPYTLPDLPAPGPALALLTPFFGPGPASDPTVRSLWDAEQPHITPALRPRADWIARLAAGASGPVLSDARLRLRLAGCHPITHPNGHGIDGTRLAGILLARVRDTERTRALTAVAAVATIPVQIPSTPTDLETVS